MDSNLDFGNTQSWTVYTLDLVSTNIEYSKKRKKKNDDDVE